MVAHTHKDIDQRWSTVSQHIMQQDEILSTMTASKKNRTNRSALNKFVTAATTQNLSKQCAMNTLLGLLCLKILETMCIISYSKEILLGKL